MKTIHKYVFTASQYGGLGKHKVMTRKNARFLHVANQHDRLTIWAEVDEKADACSVTLCTVLTGGEVPANSEYLGTALLENGNFVLHVYLHDDAWADVVAAVNR